MRRHRGEDRVVIGYVHRPAWTDRYISRVMTEWLECYNPNLAQRVWQSQIAVLALAPRLRGTANLREDTGCSSAKKREHPDQEGIKVLIELEVQGTLSSLSTSRFHRYIDMAWSDFRKSSMVSSDCIPYKLHLLLH
jgi:hypothetical protein